MTISAFAPSASLRDRLASIAPKREGFDFFGLGAGLRAYRTFTVLNEKTDEELATIGLKRRDIARISAGLPPLED